MTSRKLRHYRIDLRLKGVGRLQVSSGTSQRREYERRKQVLRDLHADGRLDVLTALNAGTVSMVEVLAGVRETGVKTLTALVLHRPLWASLADALKASTAGTETTDRYRLSVTTLERCGVLPKGARVRDLATVEWPRVRPSFKSASDWMHLRRALSALLSIHLGDMTHPFRREVIGRIETEKEGERTPDVTIAQFWACVDRLPSWAVDPIRCIALTGVRCGEYIHATADDLRPATLEWVVRGKTGTRPVAVAAAAWPIVCAAVPARYAPPPRAGERNSSTRRYQLLQQAWMKATRAEGVVCTLHGLRHLHGQLLSDLGESDGSVADVLGHGDAKTTRRYTKRTNRRDAAEGIAGAILKRA